MMQYEQVIDVMANLGGFATFGQLYQHTDVTNWKTKTPYATIRRIVQDERLFFKIKPGLWALRSHKSKLPDHVNFKDDISKKQREEYDHYYYQGLLLQIGNLADYDTFAPHQDKNKEFLNSTIGEVRMMPEIYPFGYPSFINHAKTIDVSWFNSRKMPVYLFEVEHSTSMDRSLIKFNELTDFNVRCFIVADKARKKEFDSKMVLHTFKALKNRVVFYDYERLSKWHASCSETKAVAAL